MKILFVSPDDGTTTCMPFVQRLQESLSKAGIHVHTFRLRSRTSVRVIFNECLRYRRVIRRFNPDIVHANYGTMTSFFCMMNSKKPFIVTFRGSDLNPAPGDNFFRSIFSHFLSQISAIYAKKIICVSKELKHRLWWKKNRVSVIPSGIQMDIFKPINRKQAKDRIGWDGAERMVLFNARTDPVGKRLDLANAAMKLVKKSVQNAKLFVFRGKTSPNEMPYYYNAADVLLMTSDHEGSPNVIKEALACNLPIVSVDVGDVRERIEGVSMSYIVKRDPKTLADVLVKLLSSPARSNGREIVKVISIERVAQQVIELYKDILSEKDVF